MRNVGVYYIQKQTDLYMIPTAPPPIEELMVVTADLQYKDDKKHSNYDKNV